VRLPEFAFRVLKRIVPLGFEREVANAKSWPPLNTWLAGLSMAVAAALLLAGCGETYRPVVTPVAVTSPAP
jgi:hypothetical protein